MMIYHDRVYGKVKIEEPVILALINSPSLQRLKGVDQAGYSPLYFKLLSLKVKKPVNRFEHSLGVFLLLKKYGASPEEQIAGLLHDVSHSVFSHTIDYVFASGSPSLQNYQDNILEKFIRQSEIPIILEKYQIEVDRVLQEKNFPLSKEPLPALCADRIDYSLRNALGYCFATIKEINYFLEHLVIKNNRWVFKNLASARKYARFFFQLNQKHYSSLATAAIFQTTADVIKQALKKNYLQKSDLFTTDQQVINKIKKQLKKDARLAFLFARMIGKTKVENNLDDYDRVTLVKSRMVDPCFITKNKIKRLSQADKKWRQIIKEELKPKKYFLLFKD